MKEEEEENNEFFVCNHYRSFNRLLSFHEYFLRR